MITRGKKNGNAIFTPGKFGANLIFRLEQINYLDLFKMAFSLWLI